MIITAAIFTATKLTRVYYYCTLQVSSRSLIISPGHHSPQRLYLHGRDLGREGGGADVGVAGDEHNFAPDVMARLCAIEYPHVVSYVERSVHSVMACTRGLQNEMRYGWWWGGGRVSKGARSQHTMATEYEQHLGRPGTTIQYHNPGHDHASDRPLLTLSSSRVCTTMKLLPDARCLLMKLLAFRAMRFFAWLPLTSFCQSSSSTTAKGTTTTTFLERGGNKQLE